MDTSAKHDGILLAGFAALFAFPVLYLFRGFDDNTLTSWNWVFGTARFLPVFGCVVPAVAAAFLLSRMRLPEQSPVLFLFFLSFASIVPLWREPEVVLDAGRYFLQAKHLELYGFNSFFREWGRSISAWTDLPLMPFLYGTLFRIAGETRPVLQVFTTLLFSSSLALTFSIGKRLWDAETGFLAAVLLLGIPCLLVQVPLMLVDVPALFFLVLALRLFIAALDDGGAPRICASALSLLLAAAAKYSVPLMLLVMPVTAVVIGRDRKKNLSRALIIFAVAALPALPVLLCAREVVSAQLGLLRSYQLPGLARWHESLASTFLFQVHPFITLFAMLGAAGAVRRKEAAFALPLFFMLFSIHIERSRYILPLFPLLTLGAARGLLQIPHGEVRRFIAYSAAAASLALVLGGYLPFLSRSTMANLQQAGALLDLLPGTSAVVRVLPQYESAGNTELSLPILDLYTSKRLIYRPESRLTPPHHIRASPLRFTWECPLPGYYSGQEPPEAGPVVVISSESLRIRPGCRSFVSDTGAFKYRTRVSVCANSRLAETVQ